jgi:proteasome accessory factor B
VVNRHGRWYVAGRDRARDAARVFRLSRIAGPVRFSGPPGSVTVPPGTDVREAVRTMDSAPARENTAVLRVRDGAGFGLRRYALAPATPDASVPATPDPDGWDTISVPFSDSAFFADQVASFGADVVVIEPPDLRDAVIRRLKGVLA